MHLLAYNLIRSLMWQAAAKHGRPLHRLSFAGTIDRLNVIEPYLQLFEGSDLEEQFYTLLLGWIAKDQLPHRPNRVEPCAVKRRPKEYALLNRPRHKMRKALSLPLLSSFSEASLLSFYLLDSLPRCEVAA